MAVEVHVGILPQRSVQRAVDLGIAAEEFGYNGVWVADSHSVMRDAYVVLTLLAAKTQTIQSQRACRPRLPAIPQYWPTAGRPCRRSPAVARYWVSAWVRVPFATSDSNRSRLAVFGGKDTVIRALIRGESVEYEGTSIQMPWSDCEVPVVMACSGPSLSSWAAGLQTAFCFRSDRIRRLSATLSTIFSKGAEQAGRSLKDLKLYMRVACAISTGPGQGA